MNNNFYNEKNKEIEFLMQFCDFPTKKKNEILLSQYNVDLKQLIITNIVSKYIKDIGRYMFNTNYNNLVYDGSIFRYDSFYSRSDSNILFYKNIYHNWGITSSDNILCLFTNCGMSAINAVISSLSYNKDMYNFIYNESIYFETIKLIRRNSCFSINKSHKKNNILYLDTSSINFLDFYKNPTVPKCLDMIILDTTCFDCLSLNRYLEIATERNIPIVLVRSHIKLDMLGTEFSRLGSIVIWMPPFLKNISMIKNFIQNIYFFLGISGSRGSILNIPPFWNKTFISLNTSRNNRIKDNCKLFYDLMINQENYNVNFNIVLPSHSFYLLLYLNTNIERSNLEVKIKFFCENNHNTLLKYAGSFGFDFISIDTFWDDEYKKDVIRFSIGDIDQKDIIKCFNVIWEWLNENFIN